MNNPTPTHEEIAQRAYQLWQNAGQPDGRHDEFWLQAETALLGKTVPVASPATHSTSTPALDRLKAVAAAESATENLMSPAPSDDAAIKAALPGKVSPATSPNPAVTTKSKSTPPAKNSGNKLR
ncbi:DUF2934 domain-containing protein [Oleiharenicola lentus]|uniref:DUF2934 domain-containing protein n=1 Tax=Oleiharenicola lentus TaxID=2508720 RepID=UPI003F66DD5D